jgi:hypothetical protein
MTTAQALLHAHIGIYMSAGMPQSRRGSWQVSAGVPLPLCRAAAGRLWGRWLTVGRGALRC